MALTNDQITALNFKDFYNQIRPYLNGEAHDAFIPIGSIISIMGNEAPLNFLICDGTVYNIADYPQLASYFAAQFESANYFGGDGVITFAVPDLQGEFLRGSGTNSHTDQGSGGDVGEHQDGTELPYIFGATSSYSVAVGRNGVISNADAVGDTAKQTNVSGSQSSSSYNTSVVPRPTNTSVLYCIAYKNVYADMSGLAEAGDGINIDNGVVSTDNMPSSDMSEVASPMPSIMSRRFKYSTEEQIVGEWIDGKPIYQKTFVSTMPTTSANGTQVTNYIEIGASVDTAVLAQGFSKSTNAWQTFPRLVENINTSNNKVLYNRIAVRPESAESNKNTVAVISNMTDSNGLPCHVTIQYTKTTD